MRRVTQKVSISSYSALYSEIHIGARQEIVAFKPSPIIVNYLVYPGTTGFMVIDYIIADKFVAPPERSGTVCYLDICID